jgi:triosephosphate isomerase
MPLDARSGKLWLGTNWKMHKSLAEGQIYCRELQAIADTLHPDIELFVIPPHTSLYPLKAMLQGSRIRLGAQNMHWEDEGAYTGEISPMMLAEIGLDLIELGHSERRQYYNENDADINRKVHAACRHGLRPLVCIGENAEQKNAGITEEVLSMQLKICLAGLSQTQAANVLIAYEPVWAIGASGIAAEAGYVGQVHGHIRRVLAGLFGEIGARMPILYGGSVNESNFESYLDQQDVGGLFIGRAAWDINRFRHILSTVHQRMNA